MENSLKGKDSVLSGEADFFSGLIEMIKAIFSLTSCRLLYIVDKPTPKV